MIHKGTVTLETERLILRRYVPEDAEAMFRNWVNDPEVTRFLTWQPHGSIDLTRKISLSDISKYEALSHYQWAVVLKSLNEPIGGINVVKIDETCKCFEMAYRIGKAWWHQGFASEALSSVIKFLFEKVGANRIAAKYDTRNPNSGAVMRKCGMSYEGTLRQSGYNNQGIYDAACYAILAEDYSVYKQAGFSFSIGDISIDCKNPDLARDFYHALTGWEKREAYDCPAVVSDDGLVMLFMSCDFAYIPPVWPEESSKQQKQIHFNFQVNDLSAAVEEAIKLGATKAAAQYGGDHFITMFDPEGHPFCLCRK